MLQNLGGAYILEIFIRHRFLQRLVWVCTVCLCPTKRLLGLQGLKEENIDFLSSLKGLKAVEFS